MNILAILRERTRLVIGTAIVALLLLACGAVAILGLSPRQALLARRLERMPDLDSWQGESGVLLCRLDFVRGEPQRLGYVEVSPVVEDESPQLVDQIAAATIEVLT